MLGRRLRAFHPVVPVISNTALGIAIMSYDGRVSFGLLGDFDAMPDLDDLAADLDAAIDELAAAAAGTPAPGAPRRAARPKTAAARS
jgi:hypothetical protein